MCRKCVDACPTHAIVAVNFPAPKPRPAEAKAENTNVEPKQEEAKA